jgi:hypothetical protein
MSIRPYTYFLGAISLLSSRRGVHAHKVPLNALHKICPTTLQLHNLTASSA